MTKPYLSTSTDQYLHFTSHHKANKEEITNDKNHICKALHSNYYQSLFTSKSLTETTFKPIKIVNLSYIQNVNKIIWRVLQHSHHLLHYSTQHKLLSKPKDCILWRQQLWGKMHRQNKMKKQIIAGKTSILSTGTQKRSWTMNIVQAHS